MRKILVCLAAAFVSTSYTSCMGLIENLPTDCNQNNGGCDMNAVCAVASGSLTCTCGDGYSGDGLTCSANVADAGTEVNECLTENGGCDVNAVCTDTPESRTCVCKEGYIGAYIDDEMSCSTPDLGSAN